MNRNLPIPTEHDANFYSRVHCNGMVDSWINRVLSPLIASSFFNRIYIRGKWLQKISTKHKKIVAKAVKRACTPNKNNPPKHRDLNHPERKD